MKYLALAALLLFTSSVCAWDDGGHMLVAQIARSQMSENAKKQADALLNYLPDERASTRSFKPRAYDFVTAACWMDDVRGVKKYDFYKIWHYINVPCKGNPEKVKAPHAISGIEYSLRVLHSKRFSSQSKARSLAVLLHVVGDVHQPLHAVDTDLGGNSFPIRGVPDLAPRMRKDGKPVDKTKPPTGINTPVYQRLHAFWDSAYRYDILAQNNRRNAAMLYDLGDSSRPDLMRLETISSELMTRYLPSGKEALNEKDAAQWVKESNTLACSLALRTPRGRQPSQKYFEEAHDASCRRIALAGYRLAMYLNSIFLAPE